MKFYLLKKWKSLNIHVLNKKGGFTLLDTVISFALFSIMLTAVYMVIVTSMKNTTKSEEKQSGALYGQQLLEEIKNGSVTIDSSGEVSNVSCGVNLSKTVGENGKSEFTHNFEDGYSAKVDISKNSTISLGKKEASASSEDSTKLYEFNINVSGKQGSLEFTSTQNSKIQGKSLSFNNIDDCIIMKLKAEKVVENNDQKIKLEIANNDDEVIKDLILPVDESDKELNNSVLKANMNFNDYKVKKNQKDNEKEYKNVKIQVYNELNIPINLCLIKPDLNMNIDVDPRVGKINKYDNRKSVNSNSSYKELYDIEIMVSKDGKQVFTTKANQNLEVR